MGSRIIWSRGPWGSASHENFKGVAEFMFFERRRAWCCHTAMLTQLPWQRDLISLQLQEAGFTDIDALDASREMLCVARDKRCYSNLICACVEPDTPLPIPDGESHPDTPLPIPDGESHPDTPLPGMLTPKIESTPNPRLGPTPHKLYRNPRPSPHACSMVHGVLCLRSSLHLSLSSESFIHLIPLFWGLVRSGGRPPGLMSTLNL